MSNQKRHEAGAAASKGGEFKAQQRPEAEVAIAAPRKPGTLGGYELKNFKKLNVGNEGGAFTATLYRDGKKVLLVQNQGTGGENRYDPANADHSYAEAVKELRSFAARAYEDDTMDPDLFIGLLRYNSQIENLATKGGFSRDEVVEANIESSAASVYESPWQQRENELLRHPEILDALRVQS